MSEEEKEAGEISRRQFLAGAGMVVGGAAVGVGGAALFIKPEDVTETIYVDVPGPDVVTFVAPDGSSFGTFNELVTYMEGLPGGIEVITEFTCPYDNQTFATLAALGAHLNAVHGGENPAGPGGEVVVSELPSLTVNGQTHKLELEPTWTLAFALREKLGLTGLKIGCDRASCGTCTILVDGIPRYSCMMLAVELEGHDIVTIEGLSDGKTLHPVQQAFADVNAQQCSYCTPGFIMAAKALWDSKPNPTLDEAREALSGHLCSCGATKAVIRAVIGGLAA